MLVPLNRLRLSLAAFLVLAATSPNAFAQPDWTPGDTYGSTMTVIATVDFDGAPSDDAADLLAAFAGGASRGVASPVNLGGDFVYFLSIGGDTDGEALTFMAYDASTGEERMLCDGVNFATDAVRGTLDDPFALFTADGSEPCALHWAVPPGFSQSMSANVAMFVDGVRSSDPADRVAAFAGNEIRGVGTPFDAGGEQVFFMEIRGDVSGETILFRGYDADTGVTYALSGAFGFVAGTTMGSPGAPFTLTSGAPLPVELAAFEARADGPDVRLTWTTASETNNAGFFVEHRAAGAAWDALGFVAGAGTTAEAHTYAYRVEALAPGRHHFRLRQVDFDGTAVYSETVAVEVAVPGAFALSAAYPNPLRDRAAVTLSVAVSQRVTVALFDVLGRRLRLLFEGPMAPGAARRFVVDAAGLPDGLYVIRAEGERFTAARTVAVVR
jgi:hypothetical protein